ncbi:hypothetical protein QWY22_09320 [Planococcus liqunii]|uniref:Uncharacterized protein n=1 Tax=Planococcus liqunii TaxID=3058394 RepID=A0ABT8MXF6_9BACL|nr:MULTISPECIES: hypothetical protein [unclassified Planococcus (in: firmicutes)]MDN7229390.1 hypothetical protein [Planococcus sp. N064]WKA52734.1 hypothetical protein QWY22_09320 [Planococcus sp. N056]
MKLEHIKNLLQISCNFNTSTISHSFSIGAEDTLTVKCLKDTFILEVTSSENQKIEYYTSIDEAAKALYNKIQATETN